MMAIDVSVADGVTVDQPLATSRIACGNRVVVPSVFTVTVDRVNRVSSILERSETGAGQGWSPRGIDREPDPGSPPPALPIQVRDPRRYEFLGEHGRGGLGRVSRAHDRELGRDVAIKELLSRGKRQRGPLPPRGADHRAAEAPWDRTDP